MSTRLTTHFCGLHGASLWPVLISGIRAGRQGTNGTAGDWILQPPPSTDVALLVDDTGEAIPDPNSGGLEATDPISTAILIALFTDARLPDSMLGRFGFTRNDQHQWHGNTFSVDQSQNEEPLGSLLWTLRRAPLVPYTCKLAEHFAALAIQPLVRQGLIGSYSIIAEVDKVAGRINMWIRVYDPDRQFQA